MDDKITLLIWLITISLTDGAVPGTFFWKPRLGLDLTVPTTESTARDQRPSMDNIKAGLVVLVDGYEAGMSVIALITTLSSAKIYPHLNPLSSYYYTNVYRWTLRYLSLLPKWLSGNYGNYCNTHKVWRRRFYYMDEFIPEWMRKFIPFVKDEEWKREKEEFKKFQKYAEPAFGKHYRYPSKTFNNWASQESGKTIENLDRSD